MNSKILVVSEKENSRYVPVHIARPLLQECGYRCSVPRCRGTSALQLEHIEEWAKLEFKKHDFHKMIILCATCHARVTSKEMHKDAIRAYKRNLAIINGRYSLYELRLLDKFRENSSATFTFSMDAKNDKKSDGIEEEVEFPSEYVAKHDYLHFKGLIDDGLIVATALPIQNQIGALDLSPLVLNLTQAGKAFLKDYFGGREID